MNNFSLYGLGSSQRYAHRVAAHLQTALSPHEERMFEDGEHKIRALSDVAGHDIFVLHSPYSDVERSVNDKLCELLFFVGALKDAGAARVSAVMPYLCYARKDQRTQPHDPVTTRYIAALFEAMGTDRVATIDVHNLAAFENAFRCRAENLEARPLFVEHFRELAQSQATVVIAPDFGAAKRTEKFRRDLVLASGSSIGTAIMEKYRSGGVVSGSTLVGEMHDKVAIIIDDLISSGGTLRRAAQACRDAGAVAVHVAATHGLFRPGAADLLTDPVFDSIAVTDTVASPYIEPQKYGKRVQILDSTRLIAAAIAHWHGEMT